MIDVATRRTLLKLVAENCEATAILDDLIQIYLSKAVHEYGDDGAVYKTIHSGLCSLAQRLARGYRVKT